MSLIIIFFFQAEDGIRALTVTGVQTCALPISRPPARSHRPWHRGGVRRSGARVLTLALVRSEERRVGKGVDLGGRRIIKKKIVTIKIQKGRDCRKRAIALIMR